MWWDKFVIKKANKARFKKNPDNKTFDIFFFGDCSSLFATFLLSSFYLVETYKTHNERVCLENNVPSIVIEVFKQYSKRSDRWKIILFLCIHFDVIKRDYYMGALS